jgi:hypothetical protein
LAWIELRYGVSRRWGLWLCAWLRGHTYGSWYSSSVGLARFRRCRRCLRAQFSRTQGRP